ncbi:MAG: PAS domain-containing sensor histidine kinase [Kiritimatiellae bacterium]|jgi:PAS domain S-box-containing protein|nr:PAS domain-containing sensor histidine kinase [Kiritimatiellia bacterium]
MNVKNISSKTMRIDVDPSIASNINDTTKKSAVKKRMPGARVENCCVCDYDSLLRAIYDAVIITDYRTGRIEECNERALDFLQYDAEEIKGKRVLKLIAGASENLLANIRHNLDSEKFTLIEGYCVRKDLSAFPAEIAVNAIKLQGDECLCFFIRDITVRKSAQTALENAVKRLENHAEAKTEFISNVSHELRTPLTSMIYAVENMLRGVTGPLPEPVAKYLTMLKSDSLRLKSTVDDILDLRKMEVDSLSLNRTKITLNSLVESSVTSLRVQAEQKHIELKYHEYSDSSFVDADISKVERVIINLINNAVKFTPDYGKIVTTIDEVERDGVKYARLNVTDTGIGIPPEYIDKVLERYVRVGEQSVGSGLGLAISREIVELHGGRIILQSPPHDSKSGTSATVEIPICENIKILFIGKDEELRSRLEYVLTKYGYRFECKDEEKITNNDLSDYDTVLIDLAVLTNTQDALIDFMKRERTKSKVPIIVVGRLHAEGEHNVIDLIKSFSIPWIADANDEQIFIKKLESTILTKGLKFTS